MATNPFGFGPKRQSSSAMPQLAPSEPEEILKDLASRTMSGLQYVGETLDKPGRAIRGLLAGRPEELANLIPFSDSMGLTDPTKATYGRDLIDMYGGGPKNVEGWNPIDNPVDAALDVAGLGVDIATDPLRFGSLGQLTKKGLQAAKTSGRVLGSSPLWKVKEIQAGERSLASLRIPFTKQTLDFTGETASKIAGHLAYNPFSRVVRQAFTLNPELRQASRVGQELADSKYSRILDIQSEVVGRAMGFDSRADELHEVFGDQVRQLLQRNPDLSEELFKRGLDVNSATTDDIVRGLAEVKDRGKLIPPLNGINTIHNLEQGITQMHSNLISKFAAAGHAAPDAALMATKQLTGTDDLQATVEMAKQFDQYVDDVVKFKDETFKELQQRGYKISELEDEFSNHTPRQMEKVLKQVFTKYKSSSMTFENAMKRTDELRDLPGGTLMINRLSKDADITGVLDKSTKEYIAKGLDINNARNMAKADAQATLQARINKIRQEYMPNGTVTDEKVKQVADYFSKLPFEVTAKGMFSGKVLDDMLDYVMRGQRVKAGLDSIYDIALNTATPASVGMPLETFFHQVDGTHSRLGFSTQQGMDHFKQLWQDKHGTPFAPGSVSVPQEFVDVAQKFLKYHSDPKETIELVKMFDKYTGFLKGALTIPWPAFHTRNAISGQWQNMVTAFDNPAHAGKAYKEVYDAMTGKNPELIRLAEFYGIMPEGGSRIADIIGGSKDAGFDIASLPQRMNPLTPFKRAAERYKQGGLIGEVDEITGNRKGVVGGLGEYGRDAMRSVEVFNRLSHFAARRLSGWSDAMAAHSTLLNHFDYSTIGRTSKFQQGLRRIIPFYGWLRNNTPKQIADLMQQPGGRQAQTVRALNALQREAQNDAFLPDYLKERVVTDNFFGEKNKKDGSRSYLTLSGFLPIEDALNKFPHAGDGFPFDPSRTMQKGLSMLHPAFQYPFEMATGKQLWSGRPLSELHQTPTNYEDLNALIHKSPFARIATTARQLMDPRKSAAEKAVNALVGGVKITDVDYNKALEYEGRRLIEELLGKVPSSREFSRLSIPADKLSELTPEQLKQYSLYQYLLKLGQQRAAETKKESSKQ